MHKAESPRAPPLRHKHDAFLESATFKCDPSISGTYNGSRTTLLQITSFPDDRLRQRNRPRLRANAGACSFLPAFFVSRTRIKAVEQWIPKIFRLSNIKGRHH